MYPCWYRHPTAPPLSAPPINRSHRDIGEHRDRLIESREHGAASPEEGEEVGKGREKGAAFNLGMEREQVEPPTELGVHGP